MAPSSDESDLLEAAVIQEIGSLQELERLRNDWQELYESCPWATPFQSPDWLIPWWNYFGSGQLLTLAVYRNSKLTGIAPFFISTHSEPVIYIVGTGISDYLDFICDPDSAPQTAVLFLEYLQKMPYRWIRCDLQEIRQESPFIHATASIAQGAQILQSSVCPVIRLAQTPELYLRTIDRNLRRSLRHAQKTMTKAIVQKATSADAGEMVEHLFRLHAKRWAGKNMSGVLGRVEIQDFHRDAVAAFAARNSLSLYTLEYNGNVVAVVYSFVKGDRVYAYLSGFDPDLADISPGAFLLWQAIQDAILSGFREFDLLRGEERYKYLWGAQDTATYRVIITPNR